MLVAFMLTTSVFGNDVTAQALAVRAEKSTAITVDSEQVAANNYGLVGVKQGNILHAWDWKFTDVTGNIKEIAEAGYSIVQVSPCQVCEDTDANNDWWKLYQPYDYAFGNSLGSADEFKKMCATAEEYGISIIVDVVANHMAGTGEGTCGTRKPEVDPWWTNDKFHNTNIKFTGVYDNDRQVMVTSNIGMPDVDTSREDVQQRMIAYLETMLDMGADGFRYDAAKHIGTTGDTGASYDTFWKNISAAVSKKRPDALVYGEILNSMPASDKLYVADGIKVTESQKGWDMKNIVQGGASKVTDKTAFTYTRESSASDLITWVENHDTYLNHWGSTGLQGNSNYMSDEQIILAWSTVAARADAQALFFARPDGCSAPKDPSNPDASNTIKGALGISTKNTIWKDKRVAAINKFKNAMVGTSEKTSTTNNGVAVIVRGNKGVVATNYSSGDANFSASGLTGLADGTYKDASGQNGSFTVSGGNVSGTIKGNSFVVLYDENAVVVPTAEPTPTISVEPPVSATPSTETKITFSADDSTFEKAFDVTINVENVEYAYYSYDGAEWTEMKDGKATVTVGADAKQTGDAYGLFVHAKGIDGKIYNASKTYTYKTKTVAPQQYKMKLRIAKDEFAAAPYVYFFDKTVTVGKVWPGTKMEAEGDYWVFTSNEMESGTAIFNDGNNTWQDPEENKGGYEVSGYMEYSKTAKTVTAFTEFIEPSIDPATTVKPVSTPNAFEDSNETPVPATETPTAEPTPTAVVDTKPVISASLQDGSSFYEETADVTLSFQNAVNVSFSVDDGPVQTTAVDAANNTVKATIGKGKIADTDVTLKVTATGADGQVTEQTFTYRKVFVKKAFVVNTMSTFASKVLDKITEEAAAVDAGAESAGIYATNPDGKKGKKATIKIDGDFSDWSEDMLIAQGAACDTATRFKGCWENWVMDSYSLYGAWDDENLYIAWQNVNTYDTFWQQDGNGPLSDRGKCGDAPVFIAIDTGKGNAMTGRMADGKGIWAADIAYETRVDNIIAIHSDLSGTPGLFKGNSSGASSYAAEDGLCLDFKSTGIEVELVDDCFPSEIKGVWNPGDENDHASYDLNSNWVDLKTTDLGCRAHNTAYDTFYEMKIPFSALGITKEDVEKNGVGVMQIISRGESGMDCVPHDPSMLDNTYESYGAEPSNSHEKDDKDTITVPLARLGNGEVIIEPTPSAPATSTPVTDVTPTPVTDVTPTPVTDVTPTPVTDVTPNVTAPVSDETAYCVNFGADKSAPQYDTTELTLSAVVYNGTAPYTYTFSVDGVDVQNSAEATYKWKGTAGDHTIKVVVKDAAGVTTGSEKQYTITASGQVITPTAEVTATPIGEPASEVPATAEVPASEVPASEVPASEVPATTVPTTDIPPTTTAPTVDLPVTGGPATGVPASEVPATEIPTVAPVVTVPPSVIPNNGTTESTKKEGLVIKSFTTDPLSTQVLGTPVNLKTEVTGGTGNIKYTYIVANQDNVDDVAAITYNATTGAAVWTPIKAGTYVIYITVTDDNNDSDCAALNYTITEPEATPTVKPTATPTTKPLKVKSLKVVTKAKKRVVKKKIVVNASVSNKKGTVKYKFYIRKKGAKKKTLVQKYSTKRAAGFKVKKAGTYYVYVYAKDSRNKTVSKYVKIKITKK